MQLPGSLILPILTLARSACSASHIAFSTWAFMAANRDTCRSVRTGISEAVFDLRMFCGGHMSTLRFQPTPKKALLAKRPFQPTCADSVEKIDEHGSPNISHHATSFEPLSRTVVLPNLKKKPPLKADLGSPSLADTMKPMTTIPKYLTLASKTAVSSPAALSQTLLYPTAKVEAAR